MKFIEEIVVEAFLPTIRSMLASRLLDRGFTQSEVADALGISQSAVSKYAHGDIDQHDAVLSDSRVQSIVEGIADGLATGEMSQVQALVELEVFIRQLERGDLLAQLHEAAVPELAGRELGFSVHDPGNELLVTERVLASVRRGLTTLEHTRGFVTLIPNVGSNLVECIPDAETVDDVAGVPGRLFDVNGRLAVPAEPEFGASEHVASVLLAVRKAGSTARAALNIRYDRTLIDQLVTNGLTVVEFDADTEDRERAIREVSGEDVDVVYQSGGFGIEPIVYLFGESAEAVTAHVRQLCEDE